MNKQANRIKYDEFVHQSPVRCKTLEFFSFQECV